MPKKLPTTLWPRSRSRARPEKSCPVSPHWWERPSPPKRTRRHGSRRWHDRESLAADGADHRVLGPGRGEERLACRAGVFAFLRLRCELFFTHAARHLAQVDRGRAALAAAIQRCIGRLMFEVAALRVDVNRGVPELEAVDAAPVGAGEIHLRRRRGSGGSAGRQRGAESPSSQERKN